MLAGNFKKEVSCKTLVAVFNAAKNKNLHLQNLIEGIPYDLSYLLDKHERIEWKYWRRIILNSRKYFSSKEYEIMGRDYVKNGSYIEGILGAFVFFSGNKFPKFLEEYFFRMAENSFTCVDHKTEYLDENRIKVTAHIKEGCEFCEEFFLISKGVWDQFGAIIGHKDFKINITWISRGTVFDISWDKESYWFKLKRAIRWLFNIRKAFLELTDSHEALLNQYSRLEKSKRLLQKQTTQLQTAYDISKFIRQSLDIRSTLNAITTAIVNDAEFICARIKLFKDADGNNLNIETFSGIDDVNVNSIVKSISNNSENIGKLILTPKYGVDPAEIDELLNYLLPIINISIHDSLVFRAVKDYKNNLEEKVERRTAELKKAQHNLSKTINLLQDIQQSQSRFFANVSHEFRTPLTLILGPANQILEQTNNDIIREEAKFIRRNAKKLNRLANQLLDISQIEAGKMKLAVREMDIVSVIKEIVLSFQSFAETKQIALEFLHKENEINIYFDKDKVDKIISNLLSNAFKFTPEGGKIRVSINLLDDKLMVFPETGKSRQKFVEIIVSDTGIGIPKEKMDKIYDRFYQVDNSISKEYEGTGIGLSLTKELVEIHKGRIYVESEEGGGATFRIIFPLGKKHFNQDEIKQEEIIKQDIYEIEAEQLIENKNKPDLDKINKGYFNLDYCEKAEKPYLLIVEDNNDVRKYIKDILNNYYKISETSNGEEGLQTSFKLIPDLIISDIMMPKMDGIEFCSALKTDWRTSHIPVILLTAKSSLKDKVEGLEIGADAYITKPFEDEELITRIKNLLDQRKRVHEHFQKHGLFELEGTSVTSFDQLFLSKAIDEINQHISDSDFSVENLAKNLAMSRSLLHKKLIALIGKTPGDLIRKVRLDKALILIEQKAASITEIAYEVGFSNPSYFAECFRNQFGCNPSDYHKYSSPE